MDMLNYHGCERDQRRVVGGKDLYENSFPFFMGIDCDLSQSDSVCGQRTDLLDIDEGYHTMRKPVNYASKQILNSVHNWDSNTDFGNNSNLASFCGTNNYFSGFQEFDLGPLQSDSENFERYGENFKCVTEASKNPLFDILGSDLGNDPTQKSAKNSTISRFNTQFCWSSNDHHEKKKFFQPFHKSADKENGLPLDFAADSNNACVELHVTKLDESISQSHLHRTLRFMFREHVPILSSHMFVAGDGSIRASFTVPSKQHAQYAISQMHKKRIGSKKIMISYAKNNERVNLNLLKSQVVALLQAIPGQALPLFNFRELFESHYLTSISFSDLCKMPDVCSIVEQAGGRMVKLNSELKSYSEVTRFANDKQENEFPFCVRHCKPTYDQCWALHKVATSPYVFIEIKQLSENLCKLVDSHNGFVPLASLATCFEADLGIALQINQKTGVALEHLVSCCSNIFIKQTTTGIKHITLSNDNERCAEDSVLSKNVSPALAHQLLQFSREIVDLLRTCNKCQLLFNKFIPAYHHHFGRQCRIADYGFTKLIDLFDSLSSTVQVMGEGNKRFVTLTHRAQIKRFTSDLCRVLKAQNSKQMMLSDFPMLYETVFDRPFDITEYGVCVLSDILDEVNEKTIVRSELPNGDITLSRPRQDQTEMQKSKTNSFKFEVIELLSHAPEYTMQFNKFVPAYHHHFGRQCRVSEYGFTKLVELFEAIPDIVQVIECDGNNDDRKVHLTTKEAIKVVKVQIEQILWSSQENCFKAMTLTQVCAEFIRRNGYSLRADLYDCHDMNELLAKFSFMKVTHTSDGETILKLQKCNQQGPSTLHSSKRSTNTRFKNISTKKRKSNLNLNSINSENWRAIANDYGAQNSWPPKSLDTSTNNKVDVDNLLQKYGYGFNFQNEISAFSDQNETYNLVQYADTIPDTFLENAQCYGTWNPLSKSEFTVDLPMLSSESNIFSPTFRLIAGDFD